MMDLKASAHVVRAMTESFAFNLGKIPDDKLDWKPTPEAKSALQVAGEVAGVMRMMTPVFSGGEMHSDGMPHPQSLEEAQQLLAEAAEAYAAGLEAAGPEMDRVLHSPFGEMWASRAVLFGMIDLIHHHGQVTYIQSLLGDAEVYFTPDGITKYWGPPAEG